MDHPVAIVLAAGLGTRMKSTKAKVLHEVAGEPLLGHVLRSLRQAGIDDVIVVVGHQREAVAEYLHTVAPNARTAVQPEMRGTGDAVKHALPDVPQEAGTVMVLAGDTPLLTGDTLRDLLDRHAGSGAAATVLTARLGDPTGYGRIVRAGAQVRRIVEHKDATESEREIDEINSGLYLFDAEALREGLTQLTSHNAQGEEYLTDVIGWLVDQGRPVAAHLTDDPDEIHGINDRVQLAAAGAVLRQRVAERWMRAGVGIEDPATTWIEADVVLEPDAVILRNTHLSGATRIAAGAVVGPDTTLVDTAVGEGATVLKSHVLAAEIGPGATVGPFTYLRPGTRLLAASKAGAFVEIKNSQVGEGAKVPHLSYVGDAEIGEGTNIGAATVFVNYDGVAKHRTVIG
ncbi:MAG TPA: bifunctional UDP-N-acetylglucosamine diphosphorylase/glucosamine-1-phosphate N-acetyltransferase GlmU, partial [Actinomycetota bacterium]|nr:bifunctional UDP-N-acetylglucosamine diphosphorylase/glucosamine-1-phosphate N-acetyltransferase GlmU [Actinomycetota bacterium]